MRTDCVMDAGIGAAGGRRKSVDGNKKKQLRQKSTSPSPLRPPAKVGYTHESESFFPLLSFPIPSDLLLPHYKMGKNHFVWVGKPGHYVFITLSGEKLVQFQTIFNWIYCICKIEAEPTFCNVSLISKINLRHVTQLDQNQHIQSTPPSSSYGRLSLTSVNLMPFSTFLEISVYYLF